MKAMPSTSSDQATKAVNSKQVNFKHLASYLPFVPNTDQEMALRKLGEFLDSDADDVFILVGSAGTGKTTLSHALIKGLEERDIMAVLAAPTGRAAGILESKANYQASTIHSLIYKTTTTEEGKVLCHPSKVELREPAVFIIDEASMISNKKSGSGDLFVNGSLLEDLWNFIRESHPKSKVVFVGDVCQLPPVKEEYSSALRKEYFEEMEGVRVQSHNLAQVERQGSDSPILNRATYIRDLMSKNGWAFDSIVDVNLSPLKKVWSNKDMIARYLQQRRV